MSDLKFVGLFFGGVLITVALIVGAVVFFTRNIPNRYLYCSPGWSGVCIKSGQRLTENNGCVANEQGKICGTYEVKYGQY